MWIPTSADEVEQAITDGLQETTLFDAKKELPSKSAELAKDVAAMATDGGILLYGVDEDAEGQLTRCVPIPLAGVRERVDQIVRTSIAEPPVVEIRGLPTRADPTVGYLAVIVLPSPRAPHMVVIKGDHRYYGRTDSGNKILTEGEVARLYERRQRWEIDRTAMIEAEVRHAPLPPHTDFVYLHGVCRPVVMSPNLLQHAARGVDLLIFIDQVLNAGSGGAVFPTNRYPMPGGGYSRYMRPDGVVVYVVDQPRPERPEREPGEIFDMHYDFDGTCHLFCGYVGMRSKAQARANTLCLWEDHLAGMTTRFLAMASYIYAQAGYLGPVDIGVAVTGLKGARSCHNRIFWDDLLPLDQNDYQRTARVLASELHSAGAATVSERLVMPLITAATHGRYNPFA